MSLVKSPTLTPALLAAKRRNAQTSTGPRTARGKAQSRLNALQRGERSPAYRQLWDALLCAPPCSVDRTVSAVLTPDVARHPLFAEAIAMFREAEGRVAASYRLRGGKGSPGGAGLRPSPPAVSGDATPAEGWGSGHDRGQVSKKDVRLRRSKLRCY